MQRIKLNFSYDFTLTFPESVRNHYYCLRILPHTNAIQTLNSWDLSINGGKEYLLNKDGFGTTLVYGMLGKPHRSLNAIVSGELTLAPYVYHDSEPSALYLANSALTPCFKELTEYLKRLNLPESAFRKALYLNQHIAQQFKHNELNEKTKDVNSFLLYHEGHAHDFAHLLISLLKLQGIPARFCNGFIEGIEQTHTWVEAYIDGDWRGFDPLKGIVIHDEPYIKLSHGRDFSECQPYQGIYTGKRQHSLRINGSMERDQQ